MAQTFVCLQILFFAILGTCHASNFSALIVFGDSTVDTGNNNYITTLFKANHLPYGMNFPGGKPTGRFSDGRLVPDFLAAELGVAEFSPPFLNPDLSDDDVRSGANFASAGSGYDEVTTALSGVIPIPKQIDMFKSYIERLKRVVGEREASRIISEAFILVSAGTNDISINFYDYPTRALQFTMDQYQDLLIQKIEAFIKDVYDLGGRKIYMVGIGTVGCIPFQRSLRFRNPVDTTCIEDENANMVVFNSKLQKLVAKLQQTLSGSKIVFGDVYNITMDMVKQPEKYGLEETGRGCCGTGFVEAADLCNLLTPLCPDPSKFMFFDSIHPTEAVYRVLARRIIDNGVPLMK